MAVDNEINARLGHESCAIPIAITTACHQVKVVPAPEMHAAEKRVTNIEQQVKVAQRALKVLGEVVQIGATGAYHVILFSIIESKCFVTVLQQAKLSRSIVQIVLRFPILFVLWLVV